MSSSMSATRIFYRPFSQGLVFKQKITRRERVLEKIYQKVADEENPRIGSELPKDHIYKSLYPWNSLKEFSKHLLENIVYNQNGLVAINKPYGAGVAEFKNEQLPFDKHNSLVNKTLGYSHQPACPYFLSEALPYLRNMLDMKDLRLIKTTDRYSSGIALFAASTEVTLKVQESIRRARPKQLAHLGYLLICQGYPHVESHQEKVGVAFEIVDVSESGDPIAKQAVIVSKPSETKIKNRKVKPIQVSYSTLCSNHELSVSLLEFHATSNKSHFLRLYVTNKATCILGDVLFGSRVSTLMGKHVSLPIDTSLRRDVLPLSKPLAQRLQAPAGSQGQLRIPTMIHHHSLLLPRFLKDREDLIITAPPPPHFTWTCSQLDLKLEAN